MRVSCAVATLSVAFLLVLGFPGAAGGQTGEPITAIAPDVLVPDVLEAEPDYRGLVSSGVEFWIVRDDDRIGLMTIAVLPDDARARQLVESAMLATSVGADDPGGIGDAAAAWEGRIVFARENVFVDLGLPANEVDFRARDLDAALANTGSGVRRGPAVEVVEILDAGVVGTQPELRLSTAIEGYSAFVDEFDRACAPGEANRALFATRGCVLSAPFAISPGSLSLEPVPRDASLPPGLVGENLARLRSTATSAPERNKAILALREAGDGSAVPLLIEHMEGDHGLVVRQNAIRGLGKIGGPEAVASLLRFLENPVQGDPGDQETDDAILRRTAVLALGEARDASVLPVLRALTTGRE